MIQQQGRWNDLVRKLDEKRKQLSAICDFLYLYDPKTEALQTVSDAQLQIGSLMMTIPATTKEGAYAKLREYMRSQDWDPDDDGFSSVIDELAQICSGDTPGPEAVDDRAPVASAA